MNLIAIARRGIGIAGVPPVGLAIARGIAMDLIRHADPAVLELQVAGAHAERAWFAPLVARIRTAPLPPAVAFALRVANGPSVVGSLLVAEHETALGHRIGSVVRIGLDAIELDRRDGSVPIPVAPAFVALAEAEAWARSVRWSR